MVGIFSSVNSSGSVSPLTIEILSATGNVIAWNSIIELNLTSNSIVTLPTVVGNIGKTIRFVRKDTSAFTVTLLTQAGQTLSLKNSGSELLQVNGALEIAAIDTTNARQVSNSNSAAQTATQITFTPITASATKVAVPSTNTQSAISDLATEVKTAQQDWKLTGNVGTNPVTNFIGTIDNIPLSFKVNNQRSGLINIANNQTFFGYRAGLNTTGNFNTAFGFDALLNNTTGIANTAIGRFALLNNTTGGSNVGVGINALIANTTGSRNIGIGENAIGINTSGSDNVGIGGFSLSTNTASNNTAVGSYSLQVNTVGNFNTAFGISSLAANTTGVTNTAIGGNSGLTNTVGNNNTYIGYYADATVNNLNNAIAIGYTAKVSQNNSVVFGNTSIPLKIGLNTTAPILSLDLSAKTDGIILPKGTTAQQDILSPDGSQRYNTSLNLMEFKENGKWVTKQNSSRIWSKGINGTSANIAANTAINLLAAGDTGSDIFAASDFTVLPTNKEISVFVNGIKAYRTTGTLATSIGTAYTITTAGVLTLNVTCNILEVTLNK